MSSTYTYEPKHILITGGAGFIASHVVERLCAQYPTYKVRVTNHRYFNCAVLTANSSRTY